MNYLLHTASFLAALAAALLLDRLSADGGRRPC